MRAKDKMQVTLKVSTAQPHVLVQCHPIEVAVGGLIVSSLCGGPGPQCPAGVCGATNGWCWGGYWLSWYDLPSPSPPASSHLRPHPPPLCLFCLCSTPTLMHTCTTCMTMSHPLSD